MYHKEVTNIENYLHIQFFPRKKGRTSRTHVGLANGPLRSVRPRRWSGFVHRAVHGGLRRLGHGLREIRAFDYFSVVGLKFPCKMELTSFAGFTTLVFFVANGFVGASFCSVAVVCFELTAADLAFLNPRGADT